MVWRREKRHLGTHTLEMTLRRSRGRDKSLSLNGALPRQDLLHVSTDTFPEGLLPSTVREGGVLIGSHFM